MKTKEELNALKEEVKKMNKKLHTLTEEELAQVSGGKGFLQEISDLAKQQLSLDKEETSDRTKAFLDKMGKYYVNILPKK